MDRKVVVAKRTLLLDTFFKVEEVSVSHEKFDGSMSPYLERLTLVRGDAVGVVLVNQARGTVVLVNQFRYATHLRGQGWMTEVIAGVVDEGETAGEAARREALEEAGYDIDRLEPISTFYASPGITSERVLLYYAETRGEMPTGKGGGLADEDEDIAVQELPLAEAYARLDRGEIVDAKTIIGLQWLRARGK